MSEPHSRHPITHPEDVGEARRSVARLADASGTPAGVRDRAVAAVTELGTNLVRHAEQGGYLLLRPLAPGIEVLSVDRGPGIVDVAASVRDSLREEAPASHRDGLGLGIGLGAVRRAASLFDIYSRPGEGTVVLARFLTGRPPAADPETAGVSVPKIDGDACGDRWSARQDERDVRLLVVDGLGHGSEAEEAAVAAVDAFRRWRSDDPRELIASAHEAMLGTRGGVLTVCRLDRATRTLHASGVGNVTVVLAGRDRHSGVLPPPGTIGTVLRPPRARVDVAAWPLGTHVVIYSDGLATTVDTTAPGLLDHHPAVIAAALLRDHGRGTDDATVLVAGEAA